MRYYIHFKVGISGGALLPFENKLKAHMRVLTHKSHAPLFVVLKGN